MRALDARLGSPDGVVLDDESTLYVAGYESEHVLAVALDGSIKDLGHVAGGPDGVALGSPQGPLAGCLVINTRDGQVVARRSDGSTVVLASGGTPGDLLAVDQSGLLYVTQHEEVIRLGPAWFASAAVPVPGGLSLVGGVAAGGSGRAGSARASVAPRAAGGSPPDQRSAARRS